MHREKRINLVILCVALVGMIDSFYLSWLKLTHNETKCIPGLGDCGSVNSSAYSFFAGIPVAYIGLISYLLVIGLIVFQLQKNIEIVSITYLQFGITIIGFIFSGYLTYVELGILHEVCGFCVISAICMTLLFSLSLYKIGKLLNN